MRPRRFIVSLDLIGAHLKAARLARNLTIAELALRSGVSVATLNRMEAGDGAVALARWLACFAIVGLTEQLVASVAPERDARGEALRSTQLRRHARAPRGDDNDF